MARKLRLASNAEEKTANHFELRYYPGLKERWNNPEPHI